MDYLGDVILVSSCKAGPPTSMSLILWQPQVGLASLSITMVRLVSSGNRLPLEPPRSLSSEAAGLSTSIVCFGRLQVNHDKPVWSAALIVAHLGHGHGLKS